MAIWRGAGEVKSPRDAVLAEDVVCSFNGLPLSRRRFAQLIFSIGGVNPIVDKDGNVVVHAT